MPVFVNRDEEMQYMRERCTILQDDRITGQLPIIQFHGIGGIGKTKILREIENHCTTQGLRAIWTDANLGTVDFSHRIISQVRKYGTQVTTRNNDLFNNSIDATRALVAQKGPTVFLIDSLEGARDADLTWIENLLITFQNESKLFFILASQGVAFDDVITIARRLDNIQLKPFDRNHCLSYTSSLSKNLEAEVRDLIYDWTGGYPLAINSMVHTIEQKKLDPRKKRDQRPLLTSIREQVIRQGIFHHIPLSPDELTWFDTMFTLFAVPRRCINVSFMQTMVEKFAPQYRLNTNLAYITLPTQINHKSDVFKWNVSKTGFTLEPTIRHLFLKNLAIDQPERCKLIHKHIAEANLQLAAQTTGTERVRALLEFLYHSSYCEDGPTLRQIVESSIQQITSGPTDNFWNFHEEYDADKELQVALGVHHNTAKSLIYRHLAEIHSYRQLARNASEAERLNYLIAHFTYIIDDPNEDDLPNSERLKQSMQDVVRKESLEFRKRLYDELLREPKVQQRLQYHPNLLLPLISR
jgi:hypothetical protein